MIRIVLAAIFGGVLMFVWGAVAHMLLPFDRAALKPIPDEAAVVSTLGAHLKEPGMYSFPWIDMGAKPSDQQLHDWQEKLANGSSGLLIYRPNGAEAMSPRQLVTQFFTGLLAAFCGALLLVQLPGGFVRRALSMLLIGVAAWLSVSVPEWIWYGFTSPFLKGGLIDQAGSWLLAGIGMAAVLKPRRVRSSF
jgi:hypothetical protein